MKHLIIGSGTVGFATGRWLEANDENVYYNDIDNNLLNKLKNNGHKVADIKVSVDVYWICTAEWDVETVVKGLARTDKLVVIRSTILPGILNKLRNKYNIHTIAHSPEFLREHNAIGDIFNPDRVVIGSKSKEAIDILKMIYTNPLVVSPDISSLIKLVSNSWLATQISFWNEIYTVCKENKVNPQMVSDGVTLDKRISNYGSNMLNDPFDGFCLPKDLDAIISISKNTVLLDAVKKINERLKI